MMRLPPGAHPDASGTTFVAWSTRAREIAVRTFDEQGRRARTEPLRGPDHGRFEGRLSGVGAGTHYMFVLDGEEVPDPYARFLPLGVHAPARVVARASEPPRALLEAPPPWQWILYELHVGTFSPEGTYRGVKARLDAIAELGVTAVELMPIAAFAGERGWGYDGVAAYAPHAPYGSPDDLRALVLAAHERGLAVVLDVVYNHLGPSGNYLTRYADEYFTRTISTPWGAAPDFAHEPMRRLVVENARYWLEEFGLDGLRLDATHAIVDASSRHVLREITDVAHAMTPPRRIFFEDDRNDPRVALELGADALWTDDVHHQLHVLSTGERDGYYAAYEPTVAALAHAVREGWTFSGQPFAPWKGEPRGAPVRGSGLGPERLVCSIQNHDQVGNRALGTRLSHDIGEGAYCAASVLLLFLPATPLLFMGQEWASSSPFLYFTDHEGALGDAVREGRREEFKTFRAFSDPTARDRIPDPQSRSTFERSKLRWDERSDPAPARVLALYRAMLRLRRSDPVLSARTSWEDLEARSRGDLLEVTRRAGRSTRRLVVSFASTDSAVTAAPGERVLFASGRFEGGTLAPHAAVILAADA